MSVVTKDFGFMPESGEKVEKLIITDKDYQAAILTKGAILNAFSYKGRNIVTSSDKIETYLGRCGHMGEVVGPFANRIANGRFSLDGQVYELEINNGLNNIHSGSANFGAKLWKVVNMTDNSVELECEKKDGEGGFPGNVTIRTTYTLKNGSLTLHYKVTTDKKTVVNITNHAYFNLHGKAVDARDHVVYLDCPYYLEIDENQIPSSVKAVEGTDFDFTTPHLLSERRNGNYDHCFIFGETKRGYAACDGLKLSVETDCEAVQLYTAASYNVKGCSQGDFGPYMALCLETSGYIDSPNQKEFPSPVLSPKEIYERTTTYTLCEVDR